MSFRYPVHIPYFQVDQQGVVFNAWYLAWFDTALVDFLADINCPYDRLRADGFDQQVVHVDLDWRSGVGFGDRVEVAVSAGRVGTTSFDLHFDVHRADGADWTRTASGRITYVNITADGKAPLPGYLRTGLERDAGKDA